jgi:TolA-binding protein
VAGLAVPAMGGGERPDLETDRFSVEADGNRLTVWRVVPVVFSAIDRLTAALPRPMPPQAHAIRLHRDAPPENVHYVLCVTSEGTLVLGQQVFSLGAPGARPALVRGEIVRSYLPLETSGAWIWLVDVPVSREREVVLAVQATSADWPIRAVMISPAGARDAATQPTQPAARTSRRRRGTRQAGRASAMSPSVRAHRAPRQTQYGWRARIDSEARARAGRWWDLVARATVAGLIVLIAAGCAGTGRPAGPPLPSPLPEASRVSSPPVPGPTPQSTPGRVSDQHHLTEQLARIAAELGDVQNAMAKVAVSTQQHEGQLQAIERRIQELESRGRGGQVPRGFAPAGPPAPPRPAPRPAARNAPANDLYGTALDKYRSGDIDAAILTLQELIANYPAAPLRDRAQFRLAEIFYGQRDLRAALQEYQELAAAVPPSPRAADALLKLGLCYRGLGDESRARRAWERLAQAFPESPAARQARSLVR